MLIITADSHAHSRGRAARPAALFRAVRRSSPHNDRVTADVRATFAAAAHCFVGLVEQIPPTALGDPGLGEWDLRSLVGHTSRSLTTVITYLQQPAASIQVPTAVAYYEWVIGQLGADPAAVAERGRQAGIALGDDPAGVIAGLVRDALAALDATVGDPVIDTIAGGMLLSEYLPTRIFELTVHTLDIAAATGIEVVQPPQALADAVHLAAAVALNRGDGPALLLALTGRRGLPERYSVV